MYRQKQVSYLINNLTVNSFYFGLSLKKYCFDYKKSIYIYKGNSLN